MTAPSNYTANDIITDALQKLGVYAPGDAISAADTSRALIILNDMIDQWQNENVFMFSLTAVALTLANTGASYTIGPPGGFATITSGRPNKIQRGPGAASVLVAGTTYPVNVVSALEWSAIQSIAPGNGVPDTLFYDPQYPVGVLNVSPTPNAAMTLTFYKLVPFFSFATANTSAAFSQGTADTLKSNLAVAAKAYFSSAQLDQVLAAKAQAAKEYLRTTGTTSRAMLKRSPNPIGKPTAPSAGAQ